MGSYNGNWVDGKLNPAPRPPTVAQLHNTQAVIKVTPAQWREKAIADVRAYLRHRFPAPSPAESIFDSRLADEMTARDIYSLSETIFKECNQ